MMYSTYLSVHVQCPCSVCRHTFKVAMSFSCENFDDVHVDVGVMLTLDAVNGTWKSWPYIKKTVD